jgi:hypothetical protein
MANVALEEIHDTKQIIESDFSQIQINVKWNCKIYFMFFKMI